MPKTNELETNLKLDSLCASAEAAVTAAKPTSFPYPPDQGKTHHEHCYKQRGHHNCAVERVRQLSIDLFVIEALRVFDTMLADELEDQLDTLADEI